MSMAKSGADFSGLMNNTLKFNEQTREQNISQLLRENKTLKNVSGVLTNNPLILIGLGAVFLIMLVKK